jgi:hypothetical protein
MKQTNEAVEDNGMKRVLLITIMAVAFAFALSAPSMAAFEVGTLTVSLYNDEDKDVGFDPGINLATLAAGTPVTVTVNRNAFSATIGWNLIDAGVFGYSGSTDDKVFFATTSPVAPAVVSGSWNAFKGADDGVKLYYRNKGTNPAVGLASDFGSYWVKMDSATTPGQYAGLNADSPVGEANLAPLASGGSVTMYLYKFMRNANRDVVLVPGPSTPYWCVVTLKTGSEPPGGCTAETASTLGTTPAPKSIPTVFLALIPLATLVTLRARKRRA